MPRDERIIAQPVNFNGLNAEFATLQNIELDAKNFDGEFADLESPAITIAKGALRKLVADIGYTSIRKMIRFRKNNKDVIICALSKKTMLTSGTATGGSATTLVKTAAGWTVNAYQNKYLKYTLNDNNYYCLITSNTADTLTIPYQKTAPANLTTFEIWEPDALYEYDIALNTLTLLKDYLAPYRKWTGIAYNSFIGTPIVSGGNTVLLAETSATGGSTTTIVKSGAGWTVNAYTGKIVKYTVNEYVYYVKIKSNTSDTLTLDRVSVAAGAGTLFTIYTPAQPFSTGTWTSAGVFNSASNVSALTDSALTYYENALVGRFIYPNTTDAANAGDEYVINRNNLTNIYIDGNSSVALGKAYKIIHSTYNDKLQDTTKSWTTDGAGEHSGRYVYIRAGTGQGQLRQIVRNDMDTLYLKLGWNTVPDETSQYEIYENTAQVLYLGNGIDWLQRYDGSNITSLINRPKGEYLFLYGARVFVTGDVSLPSKASYSEVDDPEFFPVANVITPEGMDNCTGFASFGTELFLFKRRSLFQLVEGSINGYAYFVPRLKPNASGCISQHTIASVQLKGGSQLWYHDGENANSLGYSSQFQGAILTSSVSPLIDSSVAKGNVSLYDTDMECVFDGRYYWMSFPMTQDYNDFCYRYDTRYNVWMSRTGLNISAFVSVDDKVYAGTSSGTSIYLLEQDQLYDGDSNNKVAIDQRIILKGTYSTSPFEYKSLYRNRFLFDREEIETYAVLSTSCTRATEEPIVHTKKIYIDPIKTYKVYDEDSLYDDSPILDTTGTLDTPVIYIHEVDLTNFYMYKFELRNNLVDNYFRLLACDFNILPERAEAPDTIH